MTKPHDVVLERLSHLHPKIIDLSLGRVERLLKALGNPEKKLPPVVHVAGTNGKGSVLAYLRAFLEAAGYKVHAYTSPHLVRFNERIRVAGDLISDEALTALLEECEAANGTDPITFFEITTCAAFLAFSRTPADIVLLETGLGGRLDATNVLEKPALTILTSVSLDHHQYLGDSLKDIMGEKAGISKPGVTCVVASQQRESIKVLRPHVEKVGAPLVYEGEDWFTTKTANGMIYQSKTGPAIDLPAPALVGAHQVRNAGLAIACTEHLDGFSIPDTALMTGLQNVVWPARLQRLTQGPLVDQLPDGWELWLDGGHNVGAAKAITQQARAWRDKPLVMVLGMLNSKSPEGYIKALKGRVRHLRTVPIDGESNALTGAELAEIAGDLVVDVAAAEGVSAAIASLVATQSGPARILIAGSLYLAGTVLAENT